MLAQNSKPSVTIGSPISIVGGNSLNTALGNDPTEDFSNYWTAVLYLVRNGTYKRVTLGYSAVNGGQTVYCLSNGEMTAFKLGFCMTVGDLSIRTNAA
jgi:hypothetical protein